jgi:hypothetical protein
VASVRCGSPSRALLLPSFSPLGWAAYVAGWAFHFVAELDFVRESWTAPVDVERVRPAQDANEVAAEQVRSFLRRSLPSRRRDAARMFVFDVGYDPVKVQQGLEGSPCQILLRLRAGRRFYGDPSLCDPPEHIGHPRFCPY